MVVFNLDTLLCHVKSSKGKHGWFISHVKCFTATSLGNVARAVADLSFFREASLLASDWLILPWRVILRVESP